MTSERKLSTRSARSAMSSLANSALQRQKSATTDEEEEDEVGQDGVGGVLRGVANQWVNVNHIALVVRDIGRSLHFYSDIIGMRQVIRPDFDR